MTTLAEIEAAAEALPPREKAELLQHLQRLVARTQGQETSDHAGHSLTDRQPDLHLGAWETTADFDAPLADEFWTGRKG